MGRIFDLIANSGDGVFAVDRHQSVVLWNDRATAILGFTAEEVLGKKCYAIVCGRDARGCVVCRRGCAALTSARQLKPEATTDIAARTKSGAEVWLNVSTVIVPSRRDDLSVLVHLFREVTKEQRNVAGGFFRVALVEPVAHNHGMVPGLALDRPHPGDLLEPFRIGRFSLFGSAK